MLFDHIEEKEAVERAALIEKNGITFYTLLAEKINDKGMKAVIKRIAEDEKKHLRVIEKKYFPEAGFPMDVTDEEIEIEKYVKKNTPDLFTRRINIEKLFALVTEPKKALLIALDTEIHSAEYFENLSKRAMTEEGRKIYRELAEEERGHVKDIEGILESL